MSDMQEQAVSSPSMPLERERQRAVELALETLENERRFRDWTVEERERLMILSCSANDMNLWLRRNPDPDDADHPSARFVVTEIETGCSAYGETAADAVSNYFLGGVTLS